jgi:hypothetical protein
MPDIRVFVSVGRVSTPAQEQFVSAIEQHMIAAGLLPQTLGRNFWSNDQPLKAVHDLMAVCAGAAVIAFERLQVVNGVERRGSPDQVQVADVGLPTVWNQLEAAMAYMKGLPLLVLMENGLKMEGLLEPGYDWYVKRMQVAPDVAEDREFVGLFTDWRARVTAHASKRAARSASAAATGSLPSAEATEDESGLAVRKHLRTALMDQFSEDELRALCFDLGADYENLSGSSKLGRVIEMIKYFERRRCLDRLRDAVRSARS